MKKFHQIIGVVVVVVLCLVCFFLLISNKKTDEERFYDRRAKLTEVKNWDDIETFKIAFKKAVEHEGVVIADHFISIWAHNSGIITHGMVYHVLTDENEYFTYSIDSNSSSIFEEITNLS